MRKFLIVGLAVAAVPVGIAFGATNPDWLKVTGGGQVIVDAQGGGPGDTIAFNAQQTSDTPISGGDRGFPAKGQLQVIKRDPNANGKPQVRYHGLVTCIREFTDTNDPNDTSDDERYVRFGGNKKVGTANALPNFTVDVQDNGQGLAAPESDMIYFRQRTLGQGETPCDTTDTGTDLRTSMLARGNVQEH